MHTGPITWTVIAPINKTLFLDFDHLDLVMVQHLGIYGMDLVQHSVSAPPGVGRHLAQDQVPGDQAVSVQEDHSTVIEKIEVFAATVHVVQPEHPMMDGLIGALRSHGPPFMLQVQRSSGAVPPCPQYYGHFIHPLIGINVAQLPQASCCEDAS